MITLIIYLSDLLFKTYIVITVIDDPTLKNYMLCIAIFNLYLFGYLWTLYVLIICLGVILIENVEAKKLLEKIYKKYPQYKRFRLSYEHSPFYNYIILLKRIGDQVVTTCCEFLNTIINRNIRPVPQSTLVSSIIKLFS